MIRSYKIIPSLQITSPITLINGSCLLLIMVIKQWTNKEYKVNVLCECVVSWVLRSFSLWQPWWSLGIQTCVYQPWILYKEWLPKVNLLTPMHQIKTKLLLANVASLLNQFCLMLLVPTIHYSMLIIVCIMNKWLHGIYHQNPCFF